MRLKSFVVASSAISAIWLLTGTTSCVLSEFAGISTFPIAGGQEIISISRIDARGTRVLNLYAPGAILSRWRIWVTYPAQTPSTMHGIRRWLGFVYTGTLWPGCAGVGIAWPVPTIAFALPALVAWLRKRWKQERRPGRCCICGYSLVENVSGICPECGHSVTARCPSRWTPRACILLGMAVGTPIPFAVLALTQDTPMNLLSRTQEYLGIIGLMGMGLGGLMGWRLARKRGRRSRP